MYLLSRPVVLDSLCVHVSLKSKPIIISVTSDLLYYNNGIHYTYLYNGIHMCTIILLVDPISVMSSRLSSNHYRN